MERSIKILITLCFIALGISLAFLYLTGFHSSYYQSLCQREFQENEIGITSSLSPLLEEGMERSGTWRVRFERSDAAFKGEPVVTTVYCRAYVEMCRTNGTDISYCSEYSIPFEVRL
jgi:hypothetical protein